MLQEILFFKGYQCVMSGTRRKSQLSILGFVFKVVDMTTARFLLCISKYAAPLRRLQAAIYLLWNVYLVIAITLYCEQNRIIFGIIVFPGFLSDGVVSFKEDSKVLSQSSLSYCIKRKFSSHWNIFGKRFYFLILILNSLKGWDDVYL